MAKQTGTVVVSPIKGAVVPTIIPIVTVNRKPIVNTAVANPTLDGAKVTKMRELAIGDIGYDWRVDKFVILHSDGNEYIVRRDEIALG